MSINLTPELEKFVQARVRGGLYNSASEVMREALRVYMEYVLVQEARRKELNAKIDEGLASAARGELASADKVFEKLKAERRKKKVA